MCITLNNMKASIELNDSEENRNAIINYKEQLLTLEKMIALKLLKKLYNITKILRIQIM